MKDIIEIDSIPIWIKTRKAKLIKRLLFILTLGLFGAMYEKVKRL